MNVLSQMKSKLCDILHIGQPKGSEGQRKFKRQKSLFVFCMLFLPIMHLLVFVIYVDISYVKLAFTDERTGVWTLRNFVDMWQNLTDTSQGGDSLYIAIKNTLKYSGAQIAIIPISLIMTYFLFKRIKGTGAFKILFYLPSIIPGLVWVTAWKELTSINGLYGTFMEAIGKPLEISIYKNPATATNAMVIYGLWLGLCGNMLFYYAAMIRVPDELLEYGLLEGTNPWQEAWMIVLPLISPTIGTMFVLQANSLLMSSGPILLFTQGAAETTTVSWILFEKVWNDPMGGQNVVSAIGLAFTLLTLPITFTVKFFVDKYMPPIEY